MRAPSDILASKQADAILTKAREEKRVLFQKQILELEQIQALYIKNIATLKTQIEVIEAQLVTLKGVNSALEVTNNDRLIVLKKELSEVEEKINVSSSCLNTWKQYVTLTDLGSF